MVPHVLGTRLECEVFVFFVIIGLSSQSVDMSTAPDQKHLYFFGYSKDHNNRTPPLAFRTYQILPNTNSYFHCLYYSYLDLLQQLLGYQGGALPPLGYPRGPWGRRSRQL